jgi:hypothetical protein
MFSKHQEHNAPMPDRLTFIDPSIPTKACCCPARPMVKVIMPPGPGRPHPVDLWLCGHHYRASIVALRLADAIVEDLTAASHELPASHATAVAY